MYRIYYKDPNVLRDLKCEFRCGDPDSKIFFSNFCFNLIILVITAFVTTYYEAELGRAVFWIRLLVAIQCVPRGLVYFISSLVAYDSRKRCIFTGNGLLSIVHEGRWHFITEYKFEEVVYLYMVTKDGEPYFYGVQPAVGYPITFRELSGDGAEYFRNVIQQADTIVSHVANEDWVNEQV